MAEVMDTIASSASCEGSVAASKVDRALAQVSILIELCRRRFDPIRDADLLARLGTIEASPIDPAPLHRLSERCRERIAGHLWLHVARTALALPHLTYEQLFYRGQTKILLGDWSGWVDREARLFSPYEHVRRSTYWQHVAWTTRAWDGHEDISDKTIFVIADGGHGDCLQMLRYVPWLVTVAGHVILGVRPGLASFAQHNFGCMATIVERESKPPQAFDRYTWIMSLPAHCRELPAFAPLTAPDPVPRARSDLKRLRVGACWAGQGYDSKNFQRHLPIHALAPLFDRADLHWHSLQVGDRASDALAYPGLTQPSLCLSTYADTANYMMGLDCVVSVCTSVAHLAGSLGVPTFLLLRCGADWRWEVDDRTAWYPSMRLIRQPTLGDWGSVIRSLGHQLTERSRVPRGSL
jgi:hypothetical protein